MLSRMDLAGGGRTTFMADIQGSILATQDVVTGAVTRRGYLPYGASASTAGPFGYTGQRIDPETNGLYYYRARMYAPLLGRFMQPDPIGYAGGGNLYAYVGNDPLNAIDPDGLVLERVANGVINLTQSAGEGLRQFGCGFSGGCSIFDTNERSAAYGAGQVTGRTLNTLGTIADYASIAAIALPIAGEGIAAIRAGGAVARYEVGVARDLLSRSVVGDQIQVHHVVQSSPARQIISGYARNEAPSIALSDLEHRAIPRIAGEYSGTARDLLARDIRNLRNYSDAPNSALQQLIELNKSLYPGSFAR